MSLLRLTAAIRRVQRGAAFLLVVLTLAGAVAAHHVIPTGMHMDDAPMCLAVLGAVFVVAATVVARGRLPRLDLSRLPRVTDLVTLTPRAVLARDGPLRLYVLRL